MCKMPKGGGGGDLFGGIVGGIGTSVQCRADDDSTYCRFARLMNVFVWILTIFAILYFVFIMFFKRR